ncbi:phosphatidylglycerol lysyltransferase domain-containing protein [Bacillus sp. CGMCC 1.16607]|uniref:phosphatidylglycerol lysyltransferase domain-containing protein n=1 Tax=Bacillus sp. CGMCC 1.16607 TaxID=3351842 RepID=UPI003628C7EE
MDIISELEKTSGWKFKWLKIDDIHIYYEYIKKSSIPTNEWTSAFPYLWASSNYLNILYSIIDNMLVTFRYSSSKNALELTCVPFGFGNPDQVVNVLYKCLFFCNKWNKNIESFTCVSMLNEAQLNFLQGSELFDQYFQFSFYKTKGRNVLERHYSISNLLSLSGKDFAYVREAINSMNRKVPNLIIRSYHPNDFDKLLYLYHQWYEKADEKYYYVSDQVEYCKILQYYTQLNQIVLVAELEGDIIGMISGGILPNNQSWISFRKTLNNGRGITQALVVKLAKEIHQVNPTVELLNDGTDDGQEGIIFVKEKFRPVLNLTLHSLFLNNFIV